MANFQLSMLCLAITLVIYFLNKRLYRRFRKLPLMPLVLTPTLLVMLLVFGNISCKPILAKRPGYYGY